MTDKPSPFSPAEVAQSTLALAVKLPGADGCEWSVSKSEHIDAYELRARSKTHDYLVVTIIQDGPAQKATGDHVLSILKRAIASGEAKPRSEK